MKKLNPLLLAAATVLAGHANGAVILGNLGGLTTPTGAATGGNLVRQYSSSFAGSGAALGATVTVTYTLTASSGANLSNAFDFGALFRRPEAVSDTNLPSNASITITLNSITVNSGWTINSVAKTNSVVVESTTGRTARFSVNGGAPFDFVAPAGGNLQRTFTSSNFTAIDGVGDSLSFLNVNQTEVGGMNLRDVAFSFDVVPEPSSALLGGIGVLALLRRRR